MKPMFFINWYLKSQPRIIVNKKRHQCIKYFVIVHRVRDFPWWSILTACELLVLLLIISFLKIWNKDFLKPWKPYSYKSDISVCAFKSMIQVFRSIWMSKDVPQFSEVSGYVRYNWSLSCEVGSFHTYTFLSVLLWWC